MAAVKVYATASELLRALENRMSLRGGDTASVLALCCDLARSMVYAGMGSGGVSTVMITEPMRRYLAFVGENEAARLIGSAMGSAATGWESRLLLRLQQLQDIARGSDSRWYGVPSRLVFFGRSSQYSVILGSEPTDILEARFGASIFRYGALRIVHRKEIRREFRSDESIWQSVKDWMPLETSRITDWADALVAALLDHGAFGSPVEDSDSVELYVPLKRRNAWRPLEQIDQVPDIPCVMRSRAALPTESRSYAFWLVTLSKNAGSVRIARNARVSEQHALRYMFAFDARTDHRSSAVIVRQSRGLFTCTIPRKLPYPESKILMASVTVERFLYSFHEVLYDRLRETLAALGMETSEVEAASGSIS